VNLLSDAKNCGFCGNACAAGQQCSQAACVSECSAQQALCNGACVDLKSDGNNCGSCGNACDKGTVCGDGKCGASCGAGQQLCSGSCVDTSSNPAHCGACDNSCPSGPGATPICVGGLCGVVCQQGFTSCNGGCVDLKSDENNCGSCGNACGAGEACDEGVCEVDCAAPKLICGGSCVDPASNGQHCGGCGNACKAGEVCEGGACKIACPAGTLECNGVCVDPDQDTKNCGGCGLACGAGEVCTAGSCKASCGAGQTLCSGSCVELGSDEKNCGSCGNACGAGEDCNGGQCQLSCKAQLLGNPLTDLWGFSWDGNERTTGTLEQARATCESIGGRLPTATEMHRVSAVRTSQVGQKDQVNYLWTAVPYDTDEQVVERLSDGNLARQTVTKTNVYRCVCAPPDPPGFGGSDCTGSNKAECSTLTREGKTYNIDAQDRAKLNASGAAWECAFHGGHLLDVGTQVAAIQQGLKGGQNAPHWTSDVSLSSTAMTVTWTDNVPWVASNSTLSHATMSTLNTTSFRCIGPQGALTPKAGAPAGAFALPRSGVAHDSQDRPAQKWAAAHDTCVFFGGHLTPPVDLMEAVFEGLPAGSGVKLWTADQAGFNGSQFQAATILWKGAAPRTAWDSSNAAGVASKASAGQPYRCAYYPQDAAFQGPDAAQCQGACYAVPPAIGSSETGSTLWFDVLDRPSATVAEAIDTCHKAGGRLPRERDYTEAIRGGLPNGSTSLLFTSDFTLYASNGARYVHVVRWSQQEEAFDDQYSKYMTWSAISNKHPFRCMWTSEHR
jgi:hypothetical protein